MNINGNSSVSFGAKLAPTGACSRLKNHLLDYGFDFDSMKTLQHELDRFSKDKVVFIDTFSHDDLMGSSFITGIVENSEKKRPFACQVFDSVGMLKDIADGIFHIR